jgi:hypothetical protein
MCSVQDNKLKIVTSEYVAIVCLVVHHVLLFLTQFLYIVLFENLYFIRNLGLILFDFATICLLCTTVQFGQFGAPYVFTI